MSYLLVYCITCGSGEPGPPQWEGPAASQASGRDSGLQIEVTVTRWERDHAHVCYSLRYEPSARVWALSDAPQPINFSFWDADGKRLKASDCSWLWCNASFLSDGKGVPTGEDVITIPTGAKTMTARLGSSDLESAAIKVPIR